MDKTNTYFVSYVAYREDINMPIFSNTKVELEHTIDLGNRVAEIEERILSRLKAASPHPWFSITIINYKLI